MLLPEWITAGLASVSVMQLGALMKTLTADEHAWLRVKVKEPACIAAKSIDAGEAKMVPVTFAVTEFTETPANAMSLLSTIKHERVADAVGVFPAVREITFEV